MKNKYCSPLLSMTFIFALLALATPATEALAQAYQGHLRFLESFAIRLYDRGETGQAMKEFERLQRIEPNNPVAADYLKKINAGVKPEVLSKTSAERMNGIAQDLEDLKKYIAAYERDTKELETLIRDLITENDGLYVMLEKRTRELMELRTQLFGTSYADNYRELEKSLPIARVPQRLHRPEDYLPEARPATQDAAVTGPATGTGPEAEQLLQEKRDLLVEKALTVTQTNEKLNDVKGDLADMNARLKNASDESNSLFDKIDRYYRNMKEEAALRNFDSQQAFSDLIIDYAAKVRELESLKSSMLLKDNALTTIKPEIDSQAAEVTRLNQAIAEKDRQIAELNAQVAKLKNENLSQKTMLDRQGKDISLTTEQLNAIGQEVDKIESLLRANDQKIAELESRTSRANILSSGGTAPVPDKNSSLESLKEAADKKTALTLDLQQQNAELRAKLLTREKELAEALKAIQALKAGTTSIKGRTPEQEAALGQLNTRLTELDDAASRKATALKEQKEQLADLSERTARLEKQVVVLNSAIAEKEAELQKAKGELAAKDEKLNEQDTTILQLEERVRALDDQRLWLQAENVRMINELKGLENSPSSAPADEKLVAMLRKEIAESDAKIKAVTGENRRLNAMIKIYEERSRSGSLPAAGPAVDEAVRQPQLDIALDMQEKAALIKTLQEELEKQNKALAAAQAKVAEIELKSSANEIKKDAMKSVIGKRDDEMLKLQSELDLAKEDLAKAAAKVAQLRDAENKLFVAENEIKDSQREATDLRLEVEQVRELLRTASETSVKKDVTLKRLADEKTKLEKALTKKTEPLSVYQNKMKTYMWKSAQDMRKLKNELAAVKERLDQRNAEIANLQKKVQELSGQNAKVIKSEAANCLLHCEEQNKTTGDTSGCLLKCQQ